MLTKTVPISSNESGVYYIINLTSNKIYIGSSCNISARFDRHKHQLKYGTHSSKSLIHDFVNNEGLEFCLIESISDKKERIAREQFWMDFYDSSNPHNGYNLSPTAGTMDGYKQTVDHVEKVAAKNRGRKHAPRSAETLKRMSDAQMGHINLKDRKKVNQFSINGELIQSYVSITAAARLLNLCDSGIVNNLKGKTKKCGGFVWKYV